MPFFPIPLQDPINIKSLGNRITQSDGSIAYEGDVEVTYQGIKLLADRVVLNMQENRGVAEGHVMLIDPDGTVQADRIEFGWDDANRYAKAENATVRVANAILRARRGEFRPTEWTLIDAEGTTCLRGTPTYLVTSEKITVYPDRQAIIQEPRVSVLGHFLAQLPTQRAALTPAVPGIHLPAPAYKLGRGFGVTWAGGLLVGRDSTFNFDARSFQSTKPSAFALYTKSYLPISNATQVVAPRTDFAERFFYGYLDSITVPRPEDETNFLRARRSSLSGGFQINGSVIDRDRGTRYSKVEAVLERGGAEDGVGFLGQARLQGLQREGDGMEARVQLRGSTGLPSVRVAPRVATLARLDSAAFAGKSLYGWGRAMAGLTYTPAPWLRLSGAGFASFEGGDPQFDIDPLYSKGGFLARADLAFGGLRLSYLTKHDVRRGGYDNEIAINQVIGCVEAYYIARDYPSRSQIGVTLRVQPLIDVFKRRTQRAKAGDERNAAPSAP